MKATEHLTPWVRPDHYAGFNPVGDFVILSRHRDSDLLENCNFEVAVESLKAQSMDHGRAEHIPPDRPAAYTWIARHFLLGHRHRWPDLSRPA
jgi:hypothetical protein